MANAVVEDLKAVGSAVARLPFEEYLVVRGGDDQQLFGFGWFGMAP